MKLAFTVLVAAILACNSPAAAQRVETNIVTGGPAGTYIQIGRDIAGIAGECGYQVNARESAGSIENVMAVRDRPVTQFGIVQSDVLEYFQTFRTDNPVARRAAQGVRIAFPLYNEEIHVLARRDIADVGDLAGRRVAIGVQDSGTFLTAELILELLQIVPAERVLVGPGDALEALLSGQIDAFFYVVGAPARLFEDERIDPAAFHLLPMENEVLQTVYTPAQIPGGTYPFASEPVDIVAVKAILVTFDYQPRRSAYQRESCKVVSELSHLILSRFERLQETGHPKWSDVNMTELPPGWEVSDCVLDGIRPGYAFTCVRPDGEVIEEGGMSDDPQGNELFLKRICDRIGC